MQLFFRTNQLTEHGTHPHHRNVMPLLSPRYRLAALTMTLATLITRSATAEEPPFSLGGPERVKEILSKYKESPLPPALDKPGTQLKGYEAIDSPPSAPKRTLILRGPEVVAECIGFTTQGQEPLTGCETVRATVPWAAKKWTKATAKLGFAGYTLATAPLYTATRPGWMAKAFALQNTAMLVVVKQGIPGLNIDVLLPFIQQKEPQKELRKNMPFSLGGAERVAEIRSTYKETPLEPLLGPQLKFYIDGNAAPFTPTRGVILYGSEIVAECIMFLTLGQQPLTESEIVCNLVPWAAKKWTKNILEPPDVSLYTATSPGWVANIVDSQIYARVLVMKQGIPGMNIDDLIPENRQKKTQKDIEPAKPTANKPRQERERQFPDRGK